MASEQCGYRGDGEVAGVLRLAGAGGAGAECGTGGGLRVPGVAAGGAAWRGELADPGALQLLRAAAVEAGVCEGSGRVGSGVALRARGDEREWRAAAAGAV